MPFEGFAFPAETSALSDAEYATALEILGAVARSIEQRDTLAREHPEAASIFMPDEGWHPDSQPSFELDGSTKNAQTSYGLLASGDRDIVRQLRLYGHAFTGYQLATLEFAAKRPWLSRKLPDNWDEVVEILAGPPDQSVFDFVSVANALPEELRLNAPWKFGEMGWLIDGKIVNDDVSGYQQIICLLHENGVLSHLKEMTGDGRTLRVVEIGGGYGGLAYFLMRLFDNSLRYAIIDIPESLAFSAVYSAALFADLTNEFVENGSPFALPATPGLSYVPNSHYKQMDTDDQPVDLVINTLSMSEMSDAQIHDYCQGIQKMIGDRGLFFEQNHQTDHRGPGDLLGNYFKNLRKCTSVLLPDGFTARRGQANIWVNADYRG